MSQPVRLVEVRVLDGPNLYFPRPAIKLTLAAPAWLEMTEDRFARAVERVGSSGRIGRPWSEQRRRAVGRLASSITRRLAAASDVRIGVRSRPGPEPDQIAVAFPWRLRAATEALAREVPRTLEALLDLRRSPDRLIEEAGA